MAANNDTVTLRELRYAKKLACKERWADLAEYVERLRIDKPDYFIVLICDKLDVIPEYQARMIGATDEDLAQVQREKYEKIMKVAREISDAYADYVHDMEDVNDPYHRRTEARPFIEQAIEKYQPSDEHLKEARILIEKGRREPLTPEVMDLLGYHVNYGIFAEEVESLLDDPTSEVRSIMRRVERNPVLKARAQSYATQIPWEDRAKMTNDRHMTRIAKMDYDVLVELFGDKWYNHPYVQEAMDSLLVPIKVTDFIEYGARSRRMNEYIEFLRGDSAEPNAGAHMLAAALKKYKVPVDAYNKLIKELGVGSTYRK